MTHIINGRLIAEELFFFTHKEIAIKHNIIKLHPRIATILIGCNSSSQVYINSKINSSKAIGVYTELLIFGNKANNNILYKIISSLNKRFDIDGVLVQFPLPNHLEPQLVFRFIDYKKDIDSFSVHNIGLINHWSTDIGPCTSQGIIYILKKYIKRLHGKKVIIVGRSIIVGRPTVSLLVKEHCTVTVTHSKTFIIKNECLLADILIVSTGVSQLVRLGWVKKNTFIIDIGINKINNILLGDVDFYSTKNDSSYITPVPGGVGPATVVNLLINSLRVCLMHHFSVRNFKNPN